MICLLTVVCALTPAASLAVAPMDTTSKPEAVPGTPQNLSLAPGSGNITASWDPPTSGGSPSHYDLQYRQQNVGTWIGAVGVSSPHYIGALTNGTTYEVRVRARNTSGSSPYTQPETATPIAVPGTPDAPTLDAGDAQITASWTAPNNNGSAITQYTLAYGESGSDNWTDVVVEDGTSHTIMSLTNGTAYDVRVLATNNAGDSDWSATSTATPVAPRQPVAVPGTPDAPRLSAGNAQIIASWSAPTSGGAATYYDVQYSVSGSGNWTPAVSNLSDTSQVIESLSNGIAYEVQVRAGNSSGVSDWSASATATPRAPAVTVPVYTQTVTTVTVSECGTSALTPEKRARPEMRGNPFSDITGNWHAQHILLMNSAGVINGYPDGEFRPSRPISRAEIAAMLARALDLSASAGFEGFRDTQGHALEDSINALAERGVLRGFGDGNYHPERQTTRAQAAAIMSRALNLIECDGAPFADTRGHVLQDEIGAAAEAGIINGLSSTEFRPNEPITRAQLATIIRRALYN